jgi:hypothetical protein
VVHPARPVDAQRFNVILVTHDSARSGLSSPTPST